MLFQKKVMNLYLKKIGRYELDKAFKYQGPKDFKGLKQKPYSIKIGDEIVNGYFFYYDFYEKDELIVFSHGLDAGYLVCMSEINELCKMGYMVLAYDNIGCVSSTGETIKGFSMSLITLNSILDDLKANELYANMKINLVGYSWGGFTVLNIGSTYKGINKVVSICGFFSLKSLLKQYTHKLLRPLCYPILRHEKKINPDQYLTDAKKLLGKSNAQFCLIHSYDDNVVAYKYNTKLLVGKNCPDNVELHIYNHKKHTPQFHNESVKYRSIVIPKYRKLIKNNILDTDEKRIKYLEKIDFKKLTIVDKEVFQVIENFLKEKKNDIIS